MYIFIIFYSIFIGMNSQVNHFFSGSVCIDVKKFCSKYQGILHFLQIGLIF